MSTKIEIVVDYTDGLKYITVDNIDMDNISYIAQNKIPIEKWNTPSGGRANWKGLIEEIKALVADDKAEPVFEFKGSEKDKELFRQCFGDMIEGLDETEYVNRRLNDAAKAEHSGNFEEAFNCYILIAKKLNDADKYLYAAEYGYSIYSGEHECTATGDSNMLDKYVELLNIAFGIIKTKQDYNMSLLAATTSKKALTVPALSAYKDDFVKFYIENLIDAANYGSSDAMNELFSIYKDGVIVEQNNHQAFDWLLQLGKTGKAEAQLQIAEYYAEGQFVEQNFNAACEWYGQAAPKNAVAARKYALCLRDGTGCQQNLIQAYKWFCLAAEANDKEAKLQKALMEFQGLGTMMNQSLACKTLSELAEEGEIEASYWCGEYLWSMGDKSTACKYFKEAIAGNHIEATYKYADCLLTGIGVNKDERAAFEYYQKAAEMNYEPAVYMIAECYRNGWGCNPNTPDALEWYRKSGDLGNAKGYNMMGEILEKENNPAEAIVWYLAADDSVPPYPKAKCNLGRCYYYGIGTEIDYTKAEKYLLSAVECDDALVMAEAKYYYGVANEEGNTTKGKRLEKAFSLYKEAAHHQHPSAKAQYKLACCFRDGIGVEKNHDEAMWYFQQAAINNYSEAQYTLAKNETSDDAAINWYLRAAENGHVESQYELGRIYSVNGQSDEAIKFFRKAASKGHIEAAYRLGYLYDKLKQKTNAKRYYKMAADQGHLVALYRYGVVIDNPGTLLDDKDAMTYIIKAADKGLADAQYHVGKYCFDNYLRSNAIARVYIRKVLPFSDEQIGSKCTYYLQLAANQGKCEAMNLLGDIYATGYCICGIASNIQEAMKWYSMAADSGDSTARVKLEELKGGKK